MVHIAIVLLLSAVQSGTWYEQYQTCVRLIEQGQAAAAKPHIEAAVAARQKEGLQVPAGAQQYVDYLPYFHIARSHVRLQNWECARNALDISARLGEIPGGSPEMSEYLSLQRLTEQKNRAAQQP